MAGWFHVGHPALPMPTKTKSQELLESYLDEKQLRDWKLYRHFFVIANLWRVPDAVFQLKDGYSVVQWGEWGQGTAYHVWAVRREDFGLAEMHTSLLTQYLFLTSNNPSHLLHVACHQGRHWHDGRGVPKMKGWSADPEGKDPWVEHRRRNGLWE